MNAPVKLPQPKLWPVPQPAQPTIRLKNGYRIIRRAENRTAQNRPPIVIHLPAGLHRLWAFLMHPWNDAPLRATREQTDLQRLQMGMNRP